MTKTKFIVFTAEPDGEVSSAGGGDALAGGNGNNGNGNGNGDGGGGGGGAWRLVARAPVVIQTALPCACEYVLSNPDGTVAARGVVEPGVPAHVTSAGRGGMVVHAEIAFDPFLARRKASAFNNASKMLNCFFFLFLFFSTNFAFSDSNLCAASTPRLILACLCLWS